MCLPVSGKAGKEMCIADERGVTSTVITGTDDADNLYLNFKVGDELFGIEIKYVSQIIGMREITRMPEMSHAMKGFICLRGSVIPVMCLRLRFGLEEAEYTDRTCIVIVRTDDSEVGLIVDEIQEAITIEPGSIFPPPYSSEAGDSTFIVGVANLTDSETAILVDVHKLL